MGTRACFLTAPTSSAISISYVPQSTSSYSHQAPVWLLELAMTQNLYPEHDVCSKPPHTPQIPALTVWQPRSFQWRQQGFC